MIRGFKKKKSNKIKSFFKGLSLSRNFDIDYDEELHNHIPNNDLKLKTLKLCPKSTQTDFKKFFINSLKFNVVHLNNHNSHIKNKLPTSNSQTNSTICNPFNECSFYCTYLCKTIQNLIFCTKFRYFNEIYRNSIRRKYSMKLKSLKEVDKHLHINVTGGGCSGFQYHFNLLNGLDNNTVLIYDNDIKIFSNKESIELIKSCTLDFQEELIGSKFTLDIPNSTRKCSCGNSFEIE
uniref:HesB-family member protein, putative n=1 Tax=Theileria annulata TaxID=5874 RepID=A0A3B0MYL1_THEAN